jgi:hypothetical protein
MSWRLSSLLLCRTWSFHKEEARIKAEYENECAKIKENAAVKAEDELFSKDARLKASTDATNFYQSIHKSVKIRQAKFVEEALSARTVECADAHKAKEAAHAAAYAAKKASCAASSKNVSIDTSFDYEAACVSAIKVYDAACTVVFDKCQSIEYFSEDLFIKTVTDPFNKNIDAQISANDEPDYSKMHYPRMPSRKWNHRL